MKVVSYIKTGSSCPVVVEHNNHRYFVKLKAGMSGEYSLINEWIGNALGRKLGLNTQKTFWIDFNKDIQLDDVDIEVKDLVNKSMGLNIGFEYLKECQHILASELSNYDETELTNIYLLDILLLNVDRTPHNLNLIDNNGVLISTDYESSLFIQNLKSRNRLHKSDRVLACLKRNPLYKDLNESKVAIFLNAFRKIRIEEILNEIPEILLDQTIKEAYISWWKEQQNDSAFMRAILKELKSVNIETEEERKQRMKLNQEKMTRKIKRK